MQSMLQDTEKHQEELISVLTISLKEVIRAHFLDVCAAVHLKSNPMQKSRTSCTFCSYEDRRERFSDRKTSGALPEGEKRFLMGLVHVMEKDGGLDREAALANMRSILLKSSVRKCGKTGRKP